MPLTVQFGPWAPDQADTPIQVPDNQGPMTVPLADCLNVFFQNGSYRSIASPAASTIDGVPIAPLNAQALSAFSYFDNVASQETIFVGTAVGIQQLQANGTWSIVPFISAQSVGLIGASISFSAGNFLNTNTLRGATLTFSTGTLSGIASGQSFVAGRVVFHTGGQTILTGYNGTVFGPNFGTLIGSAMPFGVLEALEDSVSGSNGSAFLVIGVTTDPGKSAFTTVTANGVTMNSSAANYSYDPTQQTASWSWGAIFGFSQGSSYAMFMA